MRFIRRAVIANAVPWYFQTPDALTNFAPADRVVLWTQRWPKEDATRVCTTCNQPMTVHGWVHVGGIVCSGDYIFEADDGELAVRNKARFEAEYERFSP